MARAVRRAIHGDGRYEIEHMKTPVSIAEQEITAFGKLYPVNAVPTQPINERTIETTHQDS